MEQQYRKSKRQRIKGLVTKETVVVSRRGSGIFDFINGVDN